MNNLIHLIRPDNFADEVLLVKKPVLLLCMPRSDDFLSQMNLMKHIAVTHSLWLKVGLLAEEFTESFKKKFNVPGTPTYLIFLEGKEKNRMLGLTDSLTLESFVFGTLRPGDFAI
jgi:hypothetical protein